MPGIKSHDIFHKELKKHLNSKVLENYPNYDYYSVFAQGHDLLLYKNFYKVWNMPQKYRDLSLSLKMQEEDFTEFVYNYIKVAKKENVMNNENVRAFLSFGYVMHHIMDAYIHPYIIYMAGDHTVVKENETWKHGIVETLLDGYLMLTLEGKDPKKYKMHKDFKINKKIISKNLINVLDKSIFLTYEYPNQGKGLITGMKDAIKYIKYIKYDKYGIKAKLFNLIDKKWHGYQGFSNYRDYEEVNKYLNKNNHIWRNPMFKDQIYNFSFMELFNKAIKESVKIINGLETLYGKKNITREDISKVIPNISSLHGNECGHSLKINYVGPNSVKKKSFEKKIVKKIETGKKTNKMLSKSLYNKTSSNFTNKFKMNLRKILFPIVNFVAKKALKKENIILRKPKLDKKKAYIFAPTHSFDEDLIITMSLIDRNAYLVLGLTEQLKHNKDMYVGYLGTGIIHLFKDSASSRKACQEKIKKVLKNKNSVVIYPEGAFNHSQNKPILELYDSIFYIAKEMDVEIVPIASYSKYDYDKIYSIIGDPISVKDYEIKDKKIFMGNLRDTLATYMWELWEDYAPKVSRKDLYSVNDYYHDRMHEYLSVTWDPRNDDWIDEEIITKDKDEEENIKAFKEYVKNNWKEAQEKIVRDKKVKKNKYIKYM